MSEAFFLTRLERFAVRGRLLDAAFDAVRVDRSTVGQLITRNRLTPFSMDPAGAERFELRSAPVEQVTVCRGSFEDPQVLHLKAAGSVYWIGRGWASGLGQAAVFAAASRELVCNPSVIPVEVHGLCRVETVSLDDIVHLSGLG
jgi:hypothetical protein